jgi:preprotein translocase subunit SecG
MALVALPMAFGYFLWFIDFMYTQAKHFWAASDFAERLFLLGAGALFTVVICFSYQCTQAFYGAHVNGNWYNFDLIYSADSGYLVNQDVFRNVGAEQNDLRQPLFGAFAMPFAQAAWLISKVLFFLPHSYVTVLQILEMLLFLVALVLISRMMGLHGAEKMLLLCLMCVSYPVLIFSLTAEQYLFAVFYLVLLIYLQEDKQGQSLAYIGATGCMLTSGIFFPLVTWHKSFGEFVKRTLKLCGVFFAVTILSGRLTTFLDIPGYIAGYGYYAGANVPMLSKLLQYVNFVSSTLVAPASQMDFETYNHVSWQMCPVTNWQWSGILMLVLAVAGVAVKPKDRFTRICGVWMGFSLLLLGLIGWGTIDNGLLLYSLYFGWAFVAMSFQLMDRLLSRVRLLKLAVLVAAVLVVGIINVTALKAVLVFATQFYPALR